MAKSIGFYIWLSFILLYTFPLSLYVQRKIKTERLMDLSNLLA